MRYAALAIVLLVFMLSAPTATAAPITVDIFGTTVSLPPEISGSGGFDLGAPFGMRLQIDDAQPDENPAAGVYQATNPGTASFFGPPFADGEVFGTFPVPITSITADAGAGEWAVEVDAGTVVGLFTVTLEGLLTGQTLVPDQILPELGPASGQIVSTLEGGIDGTVVVSVDSVAIPEPGLALLAGVALLVGGAIRGVVRR